MISSKKKTVSCWKVLLLSRSCVGYSNIFIKLTKLKKNYISWCDAKIKGPLHTTFYDIVRERPLSELKFPVLLIPDMYLTEIFSNRLKFVRENKISMIIY